MTGPPAPVSREQLRAGTPPDRAAETAGVAREVARSGRRLVVLDDDPTGTQTVAGLPVLTRWAGDDLRWAFGQQAAAFFVLTNSRSLAPGEMARVNREVVAAVAAAARAGGHGFVIASRSDSTLRGHYPAETDVLGPVSDLSGTPFRPDTETGPTATPAKTDDDAGADKDKSKDRKTTDDKDAAKKPEEPSCAVEAEEAFDEVIYVAERPRL